MIPFSFSIPATSGGIPTLFLPGWGFDSRLISLYNLFPGQSLIILDSSADPAGAAEALLHQLERTGTGKIHIVGWSLGAQLGLDFSLAHPHRVASLSLVAMRSRWPVADITAIREGLAEDAAGFMRGFYRKCFLGYRRPYSLFVDKLESVYLAGLDETTLASGLDYLEEFSLPDKAPEVPVRIIHGRKDVVAPLAERVALRGAEELILPHAGHMVLLDVFQ